MKILLLGSTGSIGKNVCNCIRRFKDTFELTGLSCNINYKELIKQINEFNIRSACIGSSVAVEKARSVLPDSVRIFEGKQGLIDLITETEYDVVLNALVGAVGFRPTVTALKKKKRVALANKESLVIGGELISSLLDQGYGQLIPVDSEHSAILQCLNGEDYNTVENIIITASGGPFRKLPADKFKFITPQDALNHPNWDMGNKITIDSATLANKGFEVIEAHYLFNQPYENLNVIIHPQSIIHSMVTFHDGAIIAQCGVPDMELPIQYALTFPKRYPFISSRVDLSKIHEFTFYKPDLQRFPCLKYCIDAGKQGGTITTVLNASNEIAVQLFLENRINFNQIPQIIDKALNEHKNQKTDSVELIEEIDKQTRNNILQ
ncbi:MAG: 1-deoxy-D-xylulose-5-phosphate reductoisomerase [Chitinispirillia bacterium]|jgi:1-deoxy-D-xylulose-5-phosphate reductoisomerase